MDYQLKGKLAFVTAGAQGIGRAIANLLTQEGASVIAADQDEAALRENGFSLRNYLTVLAYANVIDGVLAFDSLSYLISSPNTGEAFGERQFSGAFSFSSSIPPLCSGYSAKLAHLEKYRVGFYKPDFTTETAQRRSPLQVEAHLSLEPLSVPPS